MCPRLRYASRGLFLVLHENCRVSCLAACVRFRDSDGFDNTSSIFENTVASKFSCEAFAEHRLQRLVQGLVQQRVALVPGVRDGVLGQMMFRDVDLDKAHQVPVPQVVQGLQATESNRNEHVEQEAQIPSLVKDLSVDTLKTHCTR